VTGLGEAGDHVRGERDAALSCCCLTWYGDPHRPSATVRMT